jgi:hypothetical protein
MVVSFVADFAVSAVFYQVVAGAVVVTFNMENFSEPGGNTSDGPTW